ncbi:MAG: flagellar biosynthesis protein FlhF [Holophagales bacterium]|jgi:flagellar biosynthesis protein FlhF|nr:flagellar biosynthesis protein FlhF [Holophagales bacterium]
MLVKTFEAPTMQEALAIIKQEMGEDAFILSTRKRTRTNVNGSEETVMEVTAAIDEANVPVAPTKADMTYGLRPPLASRAKTDAPMPLPTAQPKTNKTQPKSDPVPKFAEKQTAPEPSMDLQPIRRELLEIRGAVEALKEHETRNSSILTELDQLKSMLNRIQRHGMPSLTHQLPPSLLRLYGDLAANDLDPMIAVRLCEYTQRALVEHGGEDNVEHDKAHLFMRRVIADFIPVAAPIQLDPNKVQVAALVGPTGVGKTTTIAKLAAYAKLNLKQKVALLTLDTLRAGGVDQLQQYAQVLQVPIHVIITAEDLKNALHFYRDRSLILIDTPGYQLHDTERLEKLGTLLEELPLVETHLVLPATAKPRDLAEVAQRFEKLRPSRLIFTKLDETCTYGPILSTLVRVKRPISYLGTGQEVPQDLELATSRRIADLILPPAQVLS